MSTNYPTTKQTLPNPTGSDLLENATAELDHDYQHTTVNDTIEALQDKVGMDGSAVTTSHDYKLSEVTTTDKAVSKTATQTLTNKTLTAPQINFGSDATGDMIIRSGAGVTSRLPIGTTDQILSVQAGVPTWIANPSAAPASTTVAGIVELATTAETETGTDATRAVTPDGLQDMTTLAGKAWFLDEDTMSSDSATKTASQQSIKAYVDGSLNSFLGVGRFAKTYFNYKVLFSAPFGWSVSNSALTDVGTHATRTVSSANNYSFYAPITSLFGGLQFQTGKKVIVEFSASLNSTGTNTVKLGGFASSVNSFFGAYNETGFHAIHFAVHSTGALYSQVANGSAVTNVEITGVTLTNVNRYRIEFDPSSEVRFYVNGTLRVTTTTTLPTTGSMTFGLGGSGATTNLCNLISTPDFSIEI